jgi:hypothetical protein
MSFPRPVHPHVQADPLLELPASIRPIVTEGTALLISWLRYGDRNLEQRYVLRALEALARLEADMVSLSAPSEPGEVLDILHTVASTVQVELPEELGLTAYVSLLTPLPTHVLSLAAMEILRSHSYRTMPLPAEFLASQAAKEWAAVKAWLPGQLRHWRARLSNSN